MPTPTPSPAPAPPLSPASAAMPAPAPAAEPAHGGSYTRDPVTGALSLVQSTAQPGDATQEA